MFNCI